MIGPCPSWTPSLGPVLRLTRFVDCRARALGENGYQALSGSPSFTALLTGLLVLCVALFGLRLMLGERLDTARGVSLTVRIGMVLALATSWPAYQALIYRVVVQGPAEFSVVLMPAAGLDGERSAVSRIDALYTAMTQAPDVSPVNILTANGETVASTDTRPDPAALQRMATSTGFLVSVLGARFSVRLVAGLLLALGPLFASSLLFDAIRGLFVGWVRALIGTIVASVGIDLVLSLELAALENQLSATGNGIGGAPLPVDWGLMLGIVAIFGIALCVVVLAAAWVASAIRWPAARSAPADPAAIPHAPAPLLPSSQGVEQRPPEATPAGVDPRSRAAAIGVAIQTMGLREQTFSERRSEATPAATGNPATSSDSPHRRRTTQLRQSASLSRRDAL